jgi:hypothetical protein
VASHLPETSTLTGKFPRNADFRSMLSRKGGSVVTVMVPVSARRW